MSERSNSRFNAAVMAVIDAVGGDGRSGDHLPCPVCGGNSLSVKAGEKVPVVVHCFKCGREGGPAIVAKLREMGVWPTSANLNQGEFTAQPQRSDKERRNKAVVIWNDLKKSGARERAHDFLIEYMKARGINAVPSTALVTLPYKYEGGDYGSDDPGMVLPVRDREGELQGIQATWLNPDLNGKREAQPQRQSYGLIKTNFIPLTEIDWANPPATLLIGEGAETTLAAMQVTDLPGIATAGAGMMKDVQPPHCAEYIILADNGDGGQQAARTLAQRLRAEHPACVIRLATPAKPEDGKDGYDWNDALLAGIGATEMKDAIIGAHIFDPETDLTDDERYAARIAALAAMESRAFDAEREAIKRDFGVRAPTIDEDVKRYRAQQARAQQHAAPAAPDIAKLAESAKDIIACEDVLELFAEECAEVIAGEETLVKLVYLSATSRLFNKAMHLALKGPSAAGKSEVRRRVLDYFPPEAVFMFTALSEKALLYIKDDFEHKVLVMGEAYNQREVDFQDYLLRELLSESVLRYPVVQKQEDGSMETIIIEKHGPVAFMVTTTRNRLNAENETRMLSVEVDDSAEQTRRVIAMVAEVEGRNRDIAPEGLPQWHDYQRYLAAGECRVNIPWSPELAALINETKAPRLRRDFGQLLRGIKAHALLHREHRRRNKRGEIIANIEHDYKPVRALLAEVLATASELKTRKAIKETVAVVKELELAAKLDGTNDGVAVKAVAKKLDLDMSTARRRLQAAEMAGLIENLETRRYHPGRYKVTGDDLGASTLLPMTKALRAAYDARREGTKARRREATDEGV